MAENNSNSFNPYMKMFEMVKKNPGILNLLNLLAQARKQQQPQPGLMGGAGQGMGQPQMGRQPMMGLPPGAGQLPPQIQAQPQQPQAPPPQAINPAILGEGYARQAAEAARLREEQLRKIRQQLDGR